MKISSVTKDVALFIKEQIPKFVVEQHKKIIVIASIVFGLCCILYWMRSRSLSGRVNKLVENAGLQSVSSKVKSATSKSLSSVEIKEQNTPNPGRGEGSPISTAFRRSSDQLTIGGLNPTRESDDESEEVEGPLSDGVSSPAGTSFTIEGVSPIRPLELRDLSISTTNLRADSFTEELSTESSRIEQLEDQINRDNGHFIDYILEEFIVAENDCFYPRHGRRVKAFVHELDALEIGGEYRLRNGEEDKDPKEGEVLLYFGAESPVSEPKIIQDFEEGSTLLSFKTSWADGEALPEIILYARECISNLDSRCSFCTGIQEERQRRTKVKEELASVRKEVISGFFSSRISYSEEESNE